MADKQSPARSGAAVAAQTPVWRRLTAQLTVSGLVSWLLYGAIGWQSQAFAYGSPAASRPLLLVLSLLAIAFLLYLLQVGLVLSWTRARSTSPPIRGGTELALICLFAVGFRAALLFSHPIQEVDIYRYLWDGQVTAAGVNPYRFSPYQILEAAADTDRDSLEKRPDERQRLVRLSSSSPAMAEIVRRVHYGQLTTVYPPVSQAVFALAALLTPDSSDLATHLVVMKAIVVAFDLMTLCLLILTLRTASLPLEWSIVYAWCPLLMKEFANSGHLDSIAVCLTSVALYCCVRAFYSDSAPTGQPPHPSDSKTSRSRWDRRPDLDGTRVSKRWLLAASLSLAAAVGAKIYPLVFAPLVTITAWRRFGIRSAAIHAALIVGITAAMLLPMLDREQSRSPSQQARPGSRSEPVTEYPTQVDRQQQTGLAAFATQWQMNDFLFQLLYENLRPDRASQEGSQAWFTITSASARTRWVQRIASWTAWNPARIPFLITRWLTMGLFAVLAVVWAIRASRCASPELWLQHAFLTVAWFWLLLPTQNPWYWTWALPLAIFARSRAWLLLSGLTLAYYLRFWCQAHAHNQLLWGTRYAGSDFFDFVGTWLEFGPWFVLLMTESAYKRFRCRSSRKPG